MTSSILKSVRAKFNHALKSAILPVEAKILIAVSGGQDSLCLAQLIRQAQTKWRWHLAIAHCDHNWRADSADCALHVQKLVESWHIPFHLRVADQTLASEASARAWRYQMLTEIATIQECQILVTGHTRSDRAETLLYNLMRGAGSDGLQSLGWQRNLNPNLSLVRPLLEISRQETADFCNRLELPIWDDSTNQDLKYRRNRIRSELIPYMAEHFNPQIEIALSQTAELLHSDVMYLEEKAREFWQLESLPRINRIELKNQAVALQRRIVRQFLTHHLSEYRFNNSFGDQIDNVGFAEVTKFINLIDAPNRAVSAPFRQNIWAVVDHPWIYLVSGIE
jgi:tRNA(Ile)-lysidine synthase